MSLQSPKVQLSDAELDLFLSELKLFEPEDEKLAPPTNSFFKKEEKTKDESSSKIVLFFQISSLCFLAISMASVLWSLLLLNEIRKETRQGVLEIQEYFEQLNGKIDLLLEKENPKSFPEESLPLETFFPPEEIIEPLPLPAPNALNVHSPEFSVA